VAAIAVDPAENAAFYAEVIGLRLVKKTVNHDDKYTYHLYFGDGEGTLGTNITFLPWGTGDDRDVSAAGRRRRRRFSFPRTFRVHLMNGPQNSEII